MMSFLVMKLEPYFIIMFGSYQNGAERGESDIDVAFYSDQENSSYKLFLIAQELSQLIDVEVNLVEMSNASNLFQVQIFSRGTVLYSESDYLRMNLQMKAYSLYVNLNEEEAVISKSIKERRNKGEG
ncbi:type VII toxin-antitoxin system MntA family adenylyltransferase antitoxin [Halobacillus seohaensis]